MEREIKALIDESILIEAAGRFGTRVEELSFIGGFQNFIYQYIKDGEAFILRITHSSHRSQDLVEGELDWVLYLYARGMPVSRPVFSAEGKLTERVDLGESYFVISSFEKASGKRLSYPEYLGDEELFERLGEITGRMHSLSKGYTQRDKKIKRHEWIDNYYIKNIDRFIPKDQQGIHKSSRELIEKIKGLNKEKSSYGLIHGDINLGNFFIDDDKITVFDFDECQYSWFIEDIAIQLFYTVYVILDDTIEEREELAQKFMDRFMKGYRRENTVPDHWLKQLPIFLRLREIIVHVGMHRSWDLSDLNQWQRDYIQQSRDRIERGIPLVNLY